MKEKIEESLVVWIGRCMTLLRGKEQKDLHLPKVRQPVGKLGSV